MPLRSLLYPMGLLASLFFAARFLSQWLLSEKKKTSVVPPLFWRLSLLGNAIMVLHSLIQIQLPICLIQAFNGAIAWRNLNLMKTKPITTRAMLLLVSGVLGGVFLLFLGLSKGELTWMRAPTFPWSQIQTSPLPLVWHLMGFLGLTLFASRFWIQWWLAEKHKKSFLGRSFWWTSLIGGLLSLLYFIRLFDPVNILGYGLGLIPYGRNLVLLAKSKQKSLQSSNAIFVFAGEKSADLLGSKLLNHLQPNSNFYGVGGEHLKAAGMEIILPTEAFCVMGFSAVIKKLPRLIAMWRKIKKRILKDNPQAVILIDYPDFNMRLAKALRKGGYRGKLIQYVSPTVWAWRKGRIKELQKRLDLLLCILPFEKKVYAHTSLPVTYVGHPLVTTLQNHHFATNWKTLCHLPQDKNILSIFPGSRVDEISYNLKDQLNALAPFGKDHLITVSMADKKLQAPILEIIKQTSLIVNKNLFLVPGKYRYEHMQSSTAALATSGTVTLELALLEVPTVVCYTLSRLNYLLARHLFRIKVPFISLINLICEKEVFPEFIALNLDAVKLQRALDRLIEPGPQREQTLLGCSTLKQRLSSENASQKAAKAIERLLTPKAKNNGLNSV